MIVVDGGSGDNTIAIAEDAGARVLRTPKGRGIQMAAGADAARGKWILFLHADTVLDKTWTDEVSAFIESSKKAGVFTLRFDSRGFGAKIVAWGAMVRTKLFCLPYGDQGLLISSERYKDIGGFAQIELFLSLIHI